MKIRNKIHLPSSPDVIWGLIADPAVMKVWNPRIKEVVPVTLGRPKANAQYRIRYKLFRRGSNYLAEIMEYDEFTGFILHLEGGTLPKKGFVQEIYELVPDSKGTLLRQTILIEKSGIGLFGRLSLRIRNRIGRSSGKKYLACLRDLAKGSF